MANLWLSYAWLDNETGDVSFVAQQLQKAGVNVRLDRWDLTTGRRLWEQIEQFIIDPTRTSAWALYATQTSLNSQPCREEMAYALDRALAQRGEFPIIGIFPTKIGDELIPRAIKTRLYVSTTDENWAARVAAATKGERFVERIPEVAPWEVVEHNRGSSLIIEFRPRAGVWNRPFVAIPENEASGCIFSLGPRNHPPSVAVISGATNYIKDDLTIFTLQGEASSTTSGFLSCGGKRPSRICFGNLPRPQYWVETRA